VERQKFQSKVMLVPRCYFASAGRSQLCTLYGFCDASTAAYTTVIYLSIGKDSVQFVAIKTRASPLHKQTIPCLELLSCLLLVKLITHVLSTLQIVIDVRCGQCFTDSKGENKEWKHNRVREIYNLVPVNH